MEEGGGKRAEDPSVKRFEISSQDMSSETKVDGSIGGETSGSLDLDLLLFLFLWKLGSSWRRVDPGSVSCSSIGGRGSSLSQGTC